MPNKIELGIDVDSRTVASGERAVSNLNRALKGTQREMHGVQGAAQGAGAQMSKMAGLMRGVQAALVGIAGGAFVRSLMDTTMQLQRINMTFASVTGSAAGAAREMEYVRKTADALGQEVLVAAGAYAKMLAASNAAGISLQSTRNVFEGVTAAATAFGLSQYELEGALNAIQQMISKGSVQAEELRGQLGERLPGAFAIAADAMKMTVGELSKALELGKVSSTEFVEAFGPELQRRFGAFAQSAETSQRAVNELETAMLDVKKAIIEGGFQDALIKVLDTLTAIAGSDEAAAMANAIGAAFKWMADNAELAALGLGLVVAAITPWGKVAAIVAGVAAAVLALTQRTVKVGDENVKVGTIISEVWKGLVRGIQAGGVLIGAVWDAIVESAKAIPPALGAVWASIKAGFLGMLQVIATAWNNFLLGLSDKMASLEGIPGIEVAFDAVANAAASAGEKAHDLGDAIVKADAEAAVFNATAGKAGDAWKKVATAAEHFNAVAADRTLDAAIKRATVQTRERRIETEKLTRLTGRQAELQREAAAAAAKNAKATEDTADAAKKAAKETSNLKTEAEKALEATLKIEHRWNSIRDAISEAVGALTTGNLEGGATGLVTAVKDALWGEDMKKAFDDVATRFTKAIRGAMQGGGGGGSMLGLDSTTMALAGTGMANAAIGALNGDATQIGAGIGSAAGAVIGNFILPGLGGFIGSALGGAAGGFISKLFGDGDNKWQRVAGEAFTGTTYAASVRTERTVNTETDQGLSPEGRFAFQATRELLANFNRELAEYVDALGSTMQRGTKLVVNQKAALKAVTGALEEGDIGYKGEGGKAAGEAIAARVAEIMALSAEIVTSGSLALTQAQQLWRAAQERFSKENVEILRALGFSAKQISDAQARIRKELVKVFNAEMLGTVVDLGSATKQELKLWRDMQLAELREREKQALATAREIGASAALVASAFGAQRDEIRKNYRELLTDMVEEVKEAASRLESATFGADIFKQLVDQGGKGWRAYADQWVAQQKIVLEEQRKRAVAEAIRLGISVQAVNRLFAEKLIDLEQQRADIILQRATVGIAATIEKLTQRQTALESRRAEVLQELTRRSEEARKAEETLLNARKNLATGVLQPGGPMDAFNALRRQFADAIGRARRGDSGAAGEAAGLAQQLLQSGRGIYASGTGYADLFRTVNNQLLTAQEASDAVADRIDVQLDKETFAEVTEKSTAALLKALAALDTGLKDIERRIAEQTKKREQAEAKAKVA